MPLVNERKFIKMNFYFMTMFYYVVILLFNLLFNQQKHVDKGELLMSNLTLWDQLKEAKSEKYKWVDLPRMKALPCCN